MTALLFQLMPQTSRIWDQSYCQLLTALIDFPKVIGKNILEIIIMTYTSTYQYFCKLAYLLTKCICISFSKIHELLSDKFMISINCKYECFYISWIGCTKNVSTHILTRKIKFEVFIHIKNKAVLYKKKYNIFCSNSNFKKCCYFLWKNCFDHGNGCFFLILRSA